MFSVGVAEGGTHAAQTLEPALVLLDHETRFGHRHFGGGQFWESELKRHLLSPHGKVDRTRLPDEYGYLPSEWSGHLEVPIVLLEKIH